MQRTPQQLAAEASKIMVDAYNEIPTESILECARTVADSVAERIAAGEVELAMVAVMAEIVRIYPASSIEAVMGIQRDALDLGVEGYREYHLAMAADVTSMSEAWEKRMENDVVLSQGLEAIFEGVEQEA